MAGWESLFADAMTTSGVILQPASTDPAGSGGASRRKRWPRVLIVVLVVLLIAIIVSFRINLPYFALVPGQAQAVGPLLTVPSGRGHHVNGQLLLTDVGEGDVTVGNWLYYWLDSNAALYKKSDFIATGTSEQQYDQQGVVEMDESQLTAAAVSLRQLGYNVPYHNAGVLVWATQAGTGAYTKLQVGDVITAVDSDPTPTAEALSAAMVGRKPGQSVTLKVGTVDQPQKDHDVTLTLSPYHSDGKVVAIIGVQVFTQPGWTYPFHVSVNVNNIGGPSAGLAFTLGLLDTLSGGNLTGGRTISATGTICANGSVGQIGGLPQKTVAVENAHATVFLVPAAQVNQAKQKATSSLHVFGVSTLAQALQDLESLGGKLGAASHGPPPGPGGHSLPSDPAAFPCGY